MFEGIIEVLGIASVCTGVILYFLSYIELINSVNELSGMVREIKKELQK